MNLAMCVLCVSLWILAYVRAHHIQRTALHIPLRLAPQCHVKERERGREGGKHREGCEKERGGRKSHSGIADKTITSSRFPDRAGVKRLNRKLSLNHMD